MALDLGKNEGSGAPADPTPPNPSATSLALTLTAPQAAALPVRGLAQETSAPFEETPEGVILTSLESVVNWCRKYSFWPMPFATACCGIELMGVGAARNDIARFGAEVMRFSPRQCDLLIVAGRVAMKMLPVLQRIWQQMPEPKWCISMGACASTGGIFDTYAVVQGFDRFIPVDVYIPGCPPRPEQILRAILDLQDKVQRGGTMFGTALPELFDKERREIANFAAVGDVLTAERNDESRFGYRLPGGESSLGERRQ